MPGTHFIGTIEYASGNDAEATSLTWEILPGRNINFNLIVTIINLLFTCVFYISKEMLPGI